MAKIIWSKVRNPTRHVSDQLGIERAKLRKAIHIIKAQNNLSPRDRVIIHSDGTVTDVDGNDIGNIFDEI